MSSTRKPGPLPLIAGALVLAVGLWLSFSHREAERPSTQEPASTAIATPPRGIEAGNSSAPANSNRQPATAAASPPNAAKQSPPAAKAQPTAGIPAAPSATPKPPIPPTLPVPTGETAEAMIDLENVNRMIGSYRTLMGENPIGTNAEIMKALMGDNPKGAKLGPPEGMTVNGNGELVDRWGSPIFFHQISGVHMELWSAGPDRKLGTSDDLIFK